MFLIPHQSVSIQDLIKGIVVVSGNDACTAVAEHIEGTEEAFAQKMNDVAKQLGAGHSNFLNASGLPHEDHYSTCWDLARISMATIDHFPKAYEKYYSMKEFCFNKINQPNRNTLLHTGADGMKTGQSSAGKFGMVVSEQRNGRRLLLVINGCPTARAREQEARRLLNIGFQQFHPLVLTKGMPVVSIPVWRGPPIQAVVGKEFKRSLGPGQKNVVITACYKSPVRGCVKPGDVVGSLRIDIPGTDSFDIPLHAKNGTKPGFFKRFVHGCARLFR
jgi:D-alanyl-D-alanine carboxypeptidase (penicillin-binding protein 5/6)